MHGILLAGGTGSRLRPLTQVVNKHLLGVDGKFIIDYPINTLRGMGIQDVTVILGGDHFSQVVGYLQDGSRYNLNINYVYQGEAKGIAHAISLCERMTRDSDFTVILGDNVYEEPLHWQGNLGSQIALSSHPEIQRFGVAALNSTGVICYVEEKPQFLNKNFEHLAITGCYRFTSQYFEYFKDLKPSARQEYEITDIIRKYHQDGNLSWIQVNGLWSDVGTHESISYVNNFFYNKNNGNT